MCMVCRRVLSLSLPLALFSLPHTLVHSGAHTVVHSGAHTVVHTDVTLHDSPDSHSVVTFVVTFHTCIE